MTAQDFEYLAFSPADGTPPRQIVLLLHGYGRNAFFMQKMADAVRETCPQALILCPHGPQALNTAAIATPGNHVLHIPQEVRQAAGDTPPPGLQRQWFPIEGGMTALRPRLISIAARLNMFLDWQRDMADLNDNAIAIMGFSQGAGTALYTAFTRINPVAALVCHSAIILDRTIRNEPGMISTPDTLFIHGTEDGEFKQSAYDDSFEWLQHYTNGRTRHERISGMGHTTNTASRSIGADFIAQRINT